MKIKDKKVESKLLISIVLLLVFLLVALAYIFFLKTTQDRLAMAPTATATELKAFVIKNEEINLFQELPARVAADAISQVRPQVTGVIKKKFFDEGSYVEKGEQLYQIDSTVYTANYDAALFNLKAVTAKKKRYDVLIASEAISRQEYDDINAQYVAAKSEFQKARNDVAYSKVLAPISGYVGKSNFTVGNLVTANQSDVLTTITQLSPIYVDMVQASKDARGVANKEGVKVTLIVDGVEYQENGVLKLVEKFVDEETDSVRLRAKFENKEKQLLPGMFVTAKLYSQAFQGIMVPQRVTTRVSDGNLMVWVVEEGVAKSRVIKAEQIIGDKWVVVSGLKEGDVVIAEGFMKIAEGLQVKPMLITN